MQNLDSLYTSSSYHLVDHEGENILFDAISLTVIPSYYLDQLILDRFSSPKTRSTVQLELCDFPAHEVVDRIQELIDAKFLLQNGQEPKLAEIATPSNYATFMVNVSQRCNLTCSYCYVNEGYFDYEKKPIARMKLKNAERLVQLVHEHFSGIFIYGFHFYGGEPLLLQWTHYCLDKNLWTNILC